MVVVQKAPPPVCSGPLQRMTLPTVSGVPLAVLPQVAERPFTLSRSRCEAVVASGGRDLTMTNKAR